MDYRAPEDADYANVAALNAVLLALLADRRRAARWLGKLPDELARRMTRLSGLQRERLARAPFLLVSFREDDACYWEPLFAARVRPLFAVRPDRDPAEAEFLCAALGFVWQLARRDAYVARLVCGASLHWCEELAERPLVEVLACAAEHDVAVLRRATDDTLWQKLVTDATSGHARLRRAARIAALQRMLTGCEPVPAERPARAARPIDPPSLGIADRRGRDDSDTPAS